MTGPQIGHSDGQIFVSARRLFLQLVNTNIVKVLLSTLELK